MSDATTLYQTQAPTPSPKLKQLEKLVGTWTVSGPTISGQVTFAWMDGGFFLVQRGDLIHDGAPNHFVEYIGYEQKFGEPEPSKDCTSHVFDARGNHLEYVYEVDEETLTIWGGYIGSPAAYKARFSADGNTVSGAWEWPGGGYESSMTRIA